VAVRGRALLEGAHTGSQVIALTGDERLSGLYAFDVVLQTDRGRFSVDALARSRMTIELEREPGAAPHALHGMVSRARLVHEQDEHAIFSVTIVPRLSELTRSKHSRIFTDATFPQILEAVLRDEGLAPSDFRLELSGAYKTREHVCQYKESSFDFLSRWLEREGISYFFDHDGDHEVIVFTDGNASFKPVERPQVRYRPVTEGDLVGEGAHRVRLKIRSTAAKVILFDNDPLRPSLDVRGRGETGGSVGEIVRWGDNLLDPADAEREARLFAEEIASSKETFELDVRQLGLRPGYAFQVTEHPMPAYSDELYATHVRHEAVLVADDSALRKLLSLPEVSGYRASVLARRHSVQFRPARTAAWPRIGGIVDATVDGPATSDYAQIDEHGRYKATFHFDESDLVDGSRSTYIRRIQPHGGSVEGFHFPLRKGTEVSVMFLGGDPDKPVMIGAAPNVETPSKVTSQNNTKNVIHTGGETRIEMEDLGGAQWVRIDVPTAQTTLHLGAGPHNIMGTTTGKGNVVTGTNTIIEVGDFKREDVTGSLTETYNASHTLTVVGAVNETQHTSVTSTITGATDLTITGTLTETVKSAVKEEFLASFTNTVTGGTTIEYQCGMELKVRGGATETFDTTYDRTVTGGMKYTVTGDAKEELGPTSRIVDGNYDLITDGTYTLRCATLKGDASSWNNTDAMLDALVELYDETHGTDIKVELYNLSAYGFALKLYKQEKFSAKLSLALAGLSVTLAGLNITFAPNWLEPSAPQMAVGGADLEIKGVVLKL
jgi:type VI secretion system secreted protein VgrG